MLTLRLGKLLNSPAGKIMISILLGLGLASLFQKTCVGEGCVVVKSVSPDIIQKNTYEVHHNLLCAFLSRSFSIYKNPSSSPSICKARSTPKNTTPFAGIDRIRHGCKPR